MRATPEEAMIQNLEGKWPEGSLYFLPKGEALSELKKITGVDFGYDTAAWRNWMTTKQKGKEPG